MTSDIDWNPSVYDNTIDDMDVFYDANEDEAHDSTFDDQGNYRHRTTASHSTHQELKFFDAHECQDYNDVVDDILDSLHPDVLQSVYEVHAVASAPSKRDYELLRPFFAWAPADTIRRTI